MTRRSPSPEGVKHGRDSTCSNSYRRAALSYFGSAHNCLVGNVDRITQTRDPVETRSLRSCYGRALRYVHRQYLWEMAAKRDTIMEASILQQRHGERKSSFLLEPKRSA